MIRHNNKPVNQKSLGSISIQTLNKKLRPSFMPEERLTFCSIGSDEVGLPILLVATSRFGIMHSLRG